MNKTLQVPHMPETVKAMSKKIHKFSRFIRKPLIQKKARVSSLNLSFAEDSISTCDLHSNEEVDSFSIIEEEKSEVGSSPSKTHSLLPTTISYTSALYHRSYTFSCFDEKSLPIPVECRSKIVELSCDDDCMTDDEQIKGAIKKLHTALTDSITKRKQQEKEKHA